MREQGLRRLFAAAAVLLIGAAALSYYPPLRANAPVYGPIQTAQNDRLSLNRAGAAQLTALPGIGKTKAKAIVLYREENGDFTSLDQLLHVKGIGEKTLAAIKPYLFIE